MRRKAKFHDLKVGLCSMLFLLVSDHAISETLVLTPSGDGSIYTNTDRVIDNNSILVFQHIQGAIKFPSKQINARVTKATLVLSAWSLPLHGLEMDVYGFQSETGELTTEDGNAGILIDTWMLPPDMVFNQFTSFDVTEYLSTITAPYFGLNLRTGVGTNSFNSLEKNHGVPPQLVLTIAPLNVEIDVKPYNKENHINVNEASIKVAILSTSIADGDKYDFDVFQLNPETIAFGGPVLESQQNVFSMQDIDGDGDTDMVVVAKKSQDSFLCVHDTIILTGETFEGKKIFGEDNIVALGC